MQPNVTDEEINRQVQKGLRTLTEQLRQRSLEAVGTDSLPSYFDSIRESELPAGSNPSDSRPIISNPQDLLSTGLTKDKSMALGFLDADGNATSTGQLFYNLKQRGVFDETGVITPKGRAYLVEPKDLYEPENLDAYITQFDDGLTRQETTWGEKGDAIYNLGRDVLAGVGQGLLIGGKNAYYNKGIGAPFMLLGALSDTRPPELKAETTAMKLAVGEKFATNLATLNLMVDVGLNWAGDKIKDPAWWGESGAPIKEDSRALYAARQRQDKLNQTIADFDAGEVAEVVAGIEGAVGAAEQAREVIGKDAFNSIYKNIGAATEVFGGAENAIPGVLGFKLARSVPIANRLALTAQRTISKVIELDVGIEAIKASLEATAIAGQRANVGAKLATRFIDEGAAAGATPTAITRGQQATDILARTTKIADETVATSAELTAKLDELTKARNSLATKIPEAAAQATAKTLEAGRNLRAMPANLIGSVLEGFGTTLTKVDDAVSGFLKEKGFDQMYTAALGAAGVVGFAGSPVIGAVAAGAAALKTGKMFANYGKMFKYVGKEMAKVRGQIPFWQRVASHTAPGSLNRGIAHTFNMLDLGGVTSDTLRRIPRGVAAAYPADLMFEWLSDGADMRPETFSRAAAESLFIGGSFAAAGGAFMGTKKRMRELSIGDQLNLVQSMTDDKQKALYYTLPSGVRSAVATYGIANPTLIYNFKDSGSSEYDPNTNTASINVKSNNPIRPLIAHETLHHTIVKNNMEGGISALFLGDTINNTVGGLLRSRDGKLDPNFEAFRDRYYQRLNIAGMTDAEKNAIYPLEKVAVEYFIEQHSDQYAEMAESGELGAISASGDIKRKLSGVLETVLPRIPVLRDLHFKSGGMIDKNGGWVTGNGILDAEGVRTNPITNKMFRDMNRRSSGRSPGQFDPLVSDKQESGAQITLDPTKAIDSELLHPLVKVDENGRPVLVNGQPVALDKATLLERALAGLTAKEVLRRKKAENYIPEKGEAYIDELGEYVPGWLSNSVLSEMFAKNRFNPEQKRIIREVNRMIREGNGGRAVMINFPATTRNKSGKAVYKPQGATLRDTVPVAITISKDGNLLFGLMSVTKLQENIKKRSQSRLGKKLYGGNVDLILRDTQAMMQFHKDGVDSIEYFKSKYGAVEADERKKFINTMFGLLNKSEQAVLNPMLIEDGVKSKDNVYRTYRADRVSKAVAMSPEDYPAMPFSYEAVSQVKMPEQTRQMPEKRLATGQDTEQESPSNERQPSTIQAQPSRASTGGSEATGEGLRGQGGLSGGSQQLQSHGRPGDQSVPLIGLPATVKVPGIGKYTFGPNEVARNVAAEYARSVGIDYNPPKTYAKVDAARATRIADEYDKMVHAPNDPRVKESYDAMIKETIDQWEAIKKTGLIVEPIPAGAKNPYAASPRLAIIDVKDNNHLWFFPTNSGFGGTESAGIDVSGNPLMNPTGEILNGHTMLANDVFRIVHDYFGHIKEGVGFRADGEENAWRSHSAMYSDKARPAMTAETRGQNSWVNYGPFAEFNKTADAANTQYAPQKTGLLSDWVMGEGASDSIFTPELKEVRFMPEKEVDGDKGISAPIGSLGVLRKNVEIKSSNLPSNTKSMPKFVARTGSEEPWKVMEGPLRIRVGNYLTPLPNISVEKTKEFSVQNQDLVNNALIASQPITQDAKEIKRQQVAEINVSDSLDKINSAVEEIERDPFKFVDIRGYAEIMRKSGVAGDVLIPPSSLRIMLNDPDRFAELLSGGYHGDKTVSGIRESAMSGLDAVVEMRQLIKGRPPELITALHHLWGTLSKQLPPLQQEALWMRMIVNKKVMDQIQASIDGNFNLSPEQWKNIVSGARSETVGTYGKLGENATANANSFYLMLSKHNGRWDKVSDVYKNNDAVKMRYDFNTLGHGATGIKNKVQSFIGLTFGIKGNVLDRWRFVDMYLDDAMKITGAKTPRDYFKYEGKAKNVPVDKIGIYKNYGTLENNQSLFSLMLYSAMDRVSQIAIDSSPSMQKLLGNHADPGGLHWLSWNAIKNEAVGHSSLDITKNFIKKEASNGDFSKLTVDKFLEFVNNTEAFVEGTSGGGNEITRLTLKNGTFNYSKK